jgi:CRP-like cAMP-binding protein
MVRSTRLARLRLLPSFHALDEAAIERAAALADEMAVPAGYVLVYDGDWRDEVFVVSEGTAAVIVDGHAERSLGPGSVIGAEPPLGPPTPRTTVVAATPTRFFIFDRKGFATLDISSHRAGEGLTRPPGRRQAGRLA